MQPALARSMHLFVAEPSSEHALSNHPHPPIDAGRHQHPAATQQHPGGTTQQAGGRRQLAAGPNATFATTWPRLHDASCAERSDAGTRPEWQLLLLLLLLLLRLLLLHAACCVLSAFAPHTFR